MLLKPFKYNPSFHSGQFRHRIEFQSFTEIINANGFSSEEWVTQKEAWAMIKTLQGREYYQAATTQNENSMRFVIHYTKDLHPDMRVFYNSRTFDIESIINDDEANKTMTVMVKEVIV